MGEHLIIMRNNKVIKISISCSHHIRHRGKNDMINVMVKTIKIIISHLFYLKGDMLTSAAVFAAEPHLVRKLIALLD